MKIKVSSLYSGVQESTINIPVENWEHVKSWYVKWNKLHLTLNDNSEHEIDLEDDIDFIDWKRPAFVNISDENDKTLDDN